MDPTSLRLCTSCNTPQSLDQFPLTERSDGVSRPSSRCLECRRAYAREYAAERSIDPEHNAKRRERDRLRYEQRKNDPEFREKERARSRTYCSRPEVKAKTLIRSKAWLANNVERSRAYRNKWQRANKDKVAAYKKKHYEKDLETSRLAMVCQAYARRHRIFNQGGRFTIAQGRLCRVFWGHRCAYCGDRVEHPRDERKNFDHVFPVSKGGDNGPGNIVLACTACNFAKNNSYLPVEVLDVLRPQLELFVSLLPPESYEVRRNAPRYEVKVACEGAAPAMFERGVPLMVRLGSAA